MRFALLPSLAVVISCQTTVDIQDPELEEYERRYGDDFAPQTLEEFCEAFILKTDCDGVDTVEVCIKVMYEGAYPPDYCFEEIKAIWRCWLAGVHKTLCGPAGCHEEARAAEARRMAHESAGGSGPGS